MIPYDLMPEDLLNCAFIAGGYAACPGLAADMDVWIRIARDFNQGQTEEEAFADHRARLLKFFEENYLNFTPESETEIHEDYNLGELHIRKVAVVHSYNPPVHVILTNGSIGRVLANFDVSTHQIALTHDGLYRGSDWTPITQPPRMLKYSEKTPARMQKIAERYGHATATKKSLSIEQQIDAILPPSSLGRAESIRQAVCVWCKNDVMTFRDNRSRKEYGISGFCQDCQDRTFNTSEA